MKTKSIKDISAQLDRINVASYEVYVKSGRNLNRGIDLLDKAHEIAGRYYANIWQELGAVSHSINEAITKRNKQLPRAIYAGY